MPRGSYTGRFAPSPTGDLHFGSLVAAVGSFLQARAHGGRWLVRIEDLDPPREVPGSAERILEDLERFQLSPDETVVWQGTRRAAHEAALDQLAAAGLLFPCACTRAELPPGPYPGTCREGLPPGRKGRALRVRVPGDPIRFVDGVQGPVSESLAECCGDFVVRRADGLVAYQLAVVVDDAWQGVTEIVRGADLLDSTPRQVFLQRALGLPTPSYLHLPLARDPEGRKLSKSLGADPVRSMPPLDALGAALAFLGHAPPPHGDLEARWAWAREHWDAGRVPREGGAVFGADGQAVYSPA